MLPIRSLTITVDPASRSSPVEILNRWHGLIDVQIWEEGDFLPMDGRIQHGACNASDVNVSIRRPDKVRTGIISLVLFCI